MITSREKVLECFSQNIFGGRMNDDQRQGIIAIFDEWDLRKLTDLRWLAYMLGTAHHETNATMQPVREAYWLSENWRKLNLRYYPYYGRGLPQLTWEYNYRKMTDLLKARFIEKYPDFDLVANPDQALFPDVAIAVMFEGMLRADSHFGDFTGKALEDYFNDTTESWVGARYVVNVQDRAVEIAETSKTFFRCLLSSAELTPMTPATVSSVLLRFGMADKLKPPQGPIAKVQKALADRMYYWGAVDGDFGPKTLAAVQRFQRDMNITVDGVVGDMTRGLLGLST